MESIFETKEQFLKMRKEWKRYTNDSELRKGLSGEDFALYAIIRGKDWRKGFAATSNDDTIERIESYLNKCKFEYMYTKPFGNTITEEMIAKLRASGIVSWSK